MSVTLARPRGRGKGNFRVQLIFNPNSPKMLTIPNQIIVDKNTIVEWVIKFNRQDNIIFYQKYGFANFRIYFDKASPFDWRVKIFEFNRLSLNYDEAILAEGEATEEGTFKYGIEITNPDYGQLFDEDPFIKVV